MKITGYIILFFLIIEVFLRLTGFGNPIIYSKTNANFYPKSNQITTRYKGSKIKINNLGMRSNFNWQNFDKKEKILIFGDSVSYGGSYIDNKELFSELLCKKYFKEFLCGNLGVNGYNLDNIFLRIKDFDKKYYDNVVVVVSSSVNTGKSNFYDFPFYENFNYFLIRASIEVFNHIMFKYDIYDFYHKKKLFKNKKRYINQTKNFIKLIDNLSEEKKIIFFILPTLEDLVQKDNNLRISELLKFKNTNTIYLYDLMLKKNYKDLYFNNAHLNKKGHEYLAKIIYDNINEF